MASLWFAGVYFNLRLGRDPLLPNLHWRLVEARDEQISSDIEGHGTSL
jgi:hypothetical protein